MIKFPIASDDCDYLPFYLKAFQICDVIVHSVKRIYETSQPYKKYKNICLFNVTYNNHTGWLLFTYDLCPGCDPRGFFEGCYISYGCKHGCNAYNSKVTDQCTVCIKSDKFYKKNTEEGIDKDTLQNFVNRYLTNDDGDGIICEN